MAQHKTFYFSEGQYLQTLQGLHAALSSQEAFVKLLGSAQTGKSLLCEKLAQFMRRKGFRLVHFNSAVESPDMLRTLLARELKLPVSSNFARLLEDTLQLKDDRPIVLIFDDAHLLTDITLLEIYRLAEVQVHKKRVLNILLCGEMSLEKRLLSNQEFKSLLLSVTNRFVLEPMDKDILGQFFYRYAEKCGVPGLQFEAAAMNQFYKACRGYPGPALSLCRVLVDSRLGSTNLAPISKAEITRLLQNNPQQHLPGNVYSEAQKLKPLLPVAAVVVVASMGFLYQQLNSDAESPAAPEQSQAEASPFALANDQSSVDSTVAVPNQTASLVEAPANDPGQEAELTDSAEPVEISRGDEQERTVEPQLQAASPEVSEPVSDSNLALVTAEEIGIANENISQPVYEALDAAETAVEEVVQETPAQSASVLGNPVALEEDQNTADGGSPEQALAEDIASTEPGSTVPTAQVQPEITSPLQEAAAEPVSEAQLEEAMITQLEVAVSNWLQAWQSQSLDEYFGSYHSDFVPRYHNSVQAWRSNRQRVIGGAASISLQMSDFEYLGLEDGMQSVRFWLRYASSNYSDNTQKKLLLLEEADRWKIVAEINLQVRQ